MKKIQILLSLSLALAIAMSMTTAFADYSYHDRYSDNTLKRSSTVKTVVKNLQADLTKNTSYQLTHDGIFGSNTCKAAKEFQKKKSLTVDGEVGKNTKLKLFPLRDTNYNY